MPFRISINRALNVFAIISNIRRTYPICLNLSDIIAFMITSCKNLCKHNDAHGKN